MARIRFAAIPDIPQSGLSPGQFTTLNALKEDVELLMGARRGSSEARAVLRGDITVANPAAQRMAAVTATTAGYTISGASVPSLADYTKLVTDVQVLATDVAALRGTLNALINQLKG